MKNYQLAGGATVPAIGLGTWKMTPDEARLAVAQAIGIGYRHLDCASIYQNESGVGQGIADGLSDSDITRDDLWITSKLWNDCHRPEHVSAALKSTLQDLGLDQLDLYLIHWPVVHRHGCLRPESAEDFLSLEQVPILETWQALEECHRQGLCRHLGVSNFSRRKLESVFSEARIQPITNQVESHPLLQQSELVDYCQAKQIVLTAYSPLGSGDRPDAMKRGGEPSLFDNPVLKQIAKKHGCTVAQVMLVWAIQRGTIAIPKSTNPQRMKQNLDSQSITLNATDMQQIAGIDQHYRFVDGTFWETAGGPYTVANLWDE